MKKKRDNSLKGRTCENGKNQKEWKPKAESRSPTVYTDSVMLTSIADACGERAVDTCDMARAFLNADMDEFLLINFMGEQVDIMCGISDECEQYVIK